MSFSVVFSDKSTEETAIKEIARRTKDFLPRAIDLALIFFTSHYRSNLIQHMVNITLRPTIILGVEAPLLIHENKITDRGIVITCMELNNAMEIGVIDDERLENVEIALRKITKKLKRYSFMIKFMSGSINPYTYLKGARLSLGKQAKILSSGYESPRETSFIINRKLGHDIAYLALGEKVRILHRKVNGFLPLGKTFTFTKVDENKKIILEIDNKPAVAIYKKYLDETFSIFKRKRLFYLYPLGVKNNSSYNLLMLSNLLGDDSIVYTGRVETGQKGKLMLLNEDLLMEETKKTVLAAKESFSPQLVLIFDSIIRRKILKNKDREEKELIRKNLGSEVKIAGIYADYHMALDENLKEVIIEKGNSHLTFWKQ